MQLLKAYYEHLVGKHKPNQENFSTKGFELWIAVDYAGLWYEAASMKHSRKTVNETIEGPAARAYAYCLQGSFGRSAKMISSDGVASDDILTIGELKSLHLLEGEPRLQFQDYSSQAYQIDEPIEFRKTGPFPIISAAGSSKMYTTHLLQAVNCTASDQSKQLSCA